MRKHLLESFDKVYILDLHGNAKKKESTPDGGKDENVFDIMQGVSINILVKSGSKKSNQLGQVYHYDCYGKRQIKYDFLSGNGLTEISFEKLEYSPPYYFFTPRNFDKINKYEKGIKISNLFKVNSNGVETKCDALSIHFSKNGIEKVIDDFKNENVDTLKSMYPEKSDSSGWNFKKAKDSILDDKFFYREINYRPFDLRHTIITKSSGGFIGRSRFEVMQHFSEDNIGLIVPRQTTQDYRHSFLSDRIIEGNFTASAKLFGTGSLFPLYLYPEITDQQSTETHAERVPNLDPKILSKIEKSLGLDFVPEEEEGNVCMANSGEVRGDFRTTFAPIHLLDYIYAVLHSPTYRETYKEFLKIDFPRVPYPENQEQFWQLVELGGKLRKIHLLESPKTEEYITTYPVDGDNIITRKITKTSPGFELSNSEEKTGKVWINDTQYFDKVPEIAWKFYIGGYQPAQKWLKDRKGRELKFEDLLHYQKIIVALTETDRLMKEIDKIEIV